MVPGETGLVELLIESAKDREANGARKTKHENVKKVKSFEAIGVSKRESSKNICDVEVEFTQYIRLNL